MCGVCDLGRRHHGSDPKLRDVEEKGIYGVGQSRIGRLGSVIRREVGIVVEFWGGFLCGIGRVGMMYFCLKNIAFRKSVEEVLTVVY